MSQTFSPELSFIPIAAPHEITSKAEGTALVKRINRYLNTGPITRILSAKLDPHHLPYQGPYKETYCIEITPLTYLRTHWLDKEDRVDPNTGETVNDWAILKDAIDGMITHLRASFGLVPSFTETLKDGTESHWPGGGCHIHYGADLYRMSPDWYELMKAFHVNLLVDLANRPYIRWLFNQWFADEGSLCTISLPQFKTREEWGTKSLSKITPAKVFRHAMTRSCLIEPRYMVSQKGSYLTFEFRMFSMIENADELRSIVRFTEAWADSIQVQTYKLGMGEDHWAPVTITKAQLNEMAKVPSARRLCREFITSLRLPWNEYLPFFNRHYVPRIRHGIMI